MKASKLLDLLIALVFLGVIVAIIAPLFAPARWSSGPFCLSNLKQVGTAHNMYRQDYDERLPPMQTPEVFKTVLWPYLAKTYEEGEQSLSCPTLKKPYLPVASLSYVPVWRIERPDEAELLCDPDYHASNPKTLNIGFVDGHVKALPAPPPPAKLLSGPYLPPKS